MTTRPSDFPDLATAFKQKTDARGNPLIWPGTPDSGLPIRGRASLPILTEKEQEALPVSTEVYHRIFELPADNADYESLMTHCATHPHWYILRYEKDLGWDAATKTLYKSCSWMVRYAEASTRKEN